MKKHTAFFPADHLRILEKSSKEVFNLSLLVYDSVYSRIYNHKVLLDNELFKSSDDIFKSDDNGRMILDGTTASFAAFYLGKNIEVTRELIKRGIIKSIYHDGQLDFKDNFIKNVFQDPLQEGYSMACPSEEMFFYVYQKLTETTPEKYVNKQINRIVSMIQDIIISEYYKKKYSMDTIYSTGHLLLIEQMQEMPVYSFLNSMVPSEKFLSFFNIDFSTHRISKYFSNTKELLSFNEPEKQHRIELLFTEIVPDFSVIPIDVILDIKRKDRFRSLPALAEDLATERNLTDEDLIRYFVEEIWKFANKSIKVSLSEVVFNILGWMQVEPIVGLGIQLFSQSNNIKSAFEKYKHNGWILPVYKLREEGKKYF